MLPLSPAPCAQQAAQPWPFASLQLPAAPAWQGAMPTGGPAGFAALQSAPRWHASGRKRPAEAAQQQSQRPSMRAVRVKRASSAAMVQPPAAPVAPHGWPCALPHSPSAAMLHGCSLAELAPLKPDSSLLAAASVPVPTLPAPRPARARLSASGSCGGRTTPIEDSGSASSTPRAGLRCVAPHAVLWLQLCGAVHQRQAAASLCLAQLACRSRHAVLLPSPDQLNLSDPSPALLQR